MPESNRQNGISKERMKNLTKAEKANETPVVIETNVTASLHIAERPLRE
jgi:hypothetical protein